jgi:acetyl esterase/lipase
MKGASVRKVLLLGAVVAVCSSSAALAAEGGAAVWHVPGVAAGAPVGMAGSPVGLAGDPVAPGGTGRGLAALGGQVGTAEAVIVTLPRLQTATYSYGLRDDQRIDAYWRTPESGTQPAVLLLHGGYWLEGDRTSWRVIARRLADRGYAVFAADYRLSEVAPWPAQRTDAAAALVFVKRYAGHFGLDPDRIVVVGSSAGGQLAAMLGTYGAGAQRVRGVVALSPVNSPYLGYVTGGSPLANGAERKLRQAVVQLIGCIPQDGDELCWQRMDDVAPATYASAGDAPMLILHSADEFVPPAHSTQLVSALKSAGVAATLTVFPGAAHGVAILGEPDGWRTFVTWLDSTTEKVS